MSNKEQPKIAKLDTSFLIRLLKEDDPLHESAKAYYQHFLENNFVLYVSTTSNRPTRVDFFSREVYHCFSKLMLYLSDTYRFL